MKETVLYFKALILHLHEETKEKGI